MTADIVTLTLNPAIDISSDADAVRPTQKTRIFGDEMEPGGGGINVARTLDDFGVAVRAIYLAGGATGGALNEIIGRTRIERDCVPIEGDTRMSLAVYDRSTGQEYRFVPEGPEVRESEWREALRRSASAQCRYFVASGSLPRGVPDSFYAELGRALKGKDIRYVLDTSGAELRAAVEEGGLFLLKPNSRELEDLVGHSLDAQSAGQVAADIVARGKAEFVAVTMGQDGAILAGDGVLRQQPAVPLEPQSTVGAGDSFVGAMTYAFFAGLDPAQALRYGIAAGAAAASSRGARLCTAADVRRLLEQVPEGQTLPMP